jgi:tight adherence protein C
VSPLLVAVLGALGIALVVLGQIRFAHGADPISQRLAQVGSERLYSLREIELRQPFGERVLRPLIRQLAGALERLQRSRSTASTTTKVSRSDEIRRKLALAGNPYRWTTADFLGTKVLAALVFGGVLFFLLSISRHAGFAWAFGVAGAVFGWFGPDLLLRFRTASRQQDIQYGLPDALDLLVVSVEAGLGFDAAIQRLVDKRSDALALEFARVLAELRVGRSRRDAFKDLIQRTDVADLNNFVTAILQADQLGVSVARVLSVQSEQMRVLRRQRAEESAQQLQLKMLFPLAIFIFPALCVVILGPIWPMMASTNAPGI